MQSLFVLKAFGDYCTRPRKTLDTICICEKFEQKENIWGVWMGKKQLEKIYKKENQTKRRPRYLEGDDRGDYEKHYMQNG